MNDNLKNTGWDQMRKLLDKEMPVKKAWWVFPFGKIAAIIVPLLLVTTVIFYQIENHPFSKKPYTSESAFVIISKSELVDTENDLVVKVNDIIQSEKYQDLEKTETATIFESHKNFDSFHFENEVSTTTFKTPSELASERIKPQARTIEWKEAVLPTESEIMDIAIFGEEGFKISESSEGKGRVTRHEKSEDEEVTLLNRLLGLPLSLFDSCEDSLSHASHFSKPFETYRKTSPDRKYRGIAIDAGWEFPLQQKIHGVGIAAGPVFEIGTFRILSQLGIHHFGWFNQSGSYALFQSRSASQESMDLFMPTENTAAFDQPQKQALHSYSEVSLKLDLKYRLNSRWQLTTGIMGHRVFNIRYNANSMSVFDDFTSSGPDLSDPGERSQYLEYIANETVTWINNYRLTAGLGIQYQLTSKYALRAAYRQKISPFWTADNNGAGSSISAGLVIHAF
ncbi:MAG: hypothetical protein EA362_00535 [Saprospirales bacterium]|nr:MAG: hypothetical protein EA362_00535 [Saprospirales bacterium]